MNSAMPASKPTVLPPLFTWYHVKRVKKKVFLKAEGSLLGHT
jgi:hypothetical protein